MNAAAIKGGVAGLSILAIGVLAALHQVTGAEAVDFAKWTIGVFLGGMSLLGAAQSFANRPGVPPVVGEVLRFAVDEGEEPAFTKGADGKTRTNPAAFAKHVVVAAVETPTEKPDFDKA